MPKALALVDVEAAIEAAGARRLRQHRNVDLDHEAAIAPLLAIRGELLAAEQAAGAAEMGVQLSYTQIARVRPATKSRDLPAVRQDVRRALKRERVRPVDRNGSPTFPSDWLRRQGVIA